MSKDKEVSVEEAIETVLADELETATETEAVEAVEAVEADTVEEVVETDELAELQKKLVVSEEALKEQKDLVLRTKAHSQNEIRKAGLDAESKVKRTLKRFTEALLPVIDSLEMAISHANKEDEDLKAMVEGVELTLKSMVDAFSKVGIKQIDPMGEQANPEKHQIVSQQKVEGKGANEVIVVMQKGYEFNGQIIRPAMVAVAQA